MDELYWSLPLNVGEDFYCETCGWSYDEISVSRDEEGGWWGYVTFGCYGGKGAYEKGEVVEMLLEYAESGMAARDDVYEMAASVFLEEVSNPPHSF